MKLTFRQGLARYQTNVGATAGFLERSQDGSMINLVVSPDPTIAVFAHKTANYVLEELNSVNNAWGPIPSGVTSYLYWDINVVTGAITRGLTIRPPLYTGSEPAAPANDQHWFDTTNTVMKVWTGVKWVEKIRVFAAYVSSGATIVPYGQLVSQANIYGDFEGGNIILDVYGKPLRQSDGTFVTSASSLILTNGSSKTIKFETATIIGQAAEPIPAFSLVQIFPSRKLTLARSADYLTRIAGIVVEDLYTNESGYLIADGVVRNDSWNFSSSVIGKPFFCGLQGQITTTPPTTGVSQIAGYIYDTDAIYMDIHRAVMLSYEPPATLPTPAPGSAPIADFSATVFAGDAPLSVTFLDMCQNGVSQYEWDFNNDGTVDSHVQSPSHTFTEVGEYNVRLKVTNSYGTDEITKTGFITVTQPASALGVNLGVSLVGPAQVAKGTQFQVSIAVSNDGLGSASAVTRRIIIPDLQLNQVQVSSLPSGTVKTRANSSTIIDFPPIQTINSGTTYGPVLFTVLAPAATGTLRMFASTSSAEIDVATGDNEATLSVEVVS